MSHLHPDQFVDAVEGTLTEAEQHHLAACAQCRAAVAPLAAALASVQQVAVPEPSPLFWDRLSARIRAAVATEPAPRRVFEWFHWRTLAPIAALLVLVASLSVAIPRPPSPAALALSFEPLGDLSDPAVTIDDVWAMVSEMVAPLDAGVAEELGVMLVPGAAERVALHLSADEQAVLVALLEQALAQNGS